MEKEKSLIRSFVVANYFDTISTLFALEFPNLKEVGILATEVGLTETIVVKAGVTACLVGVYALAKTKGSRLAFPLEKALKISNVIVWGATVLNIAQIAMEILPE